jgi:hypothetical protein
MGFPLLLIRLERPEQDRLEEEEQGRSSSGLTLCLFALKDQRRGL